MQLTVFTLDEFCKRIKKLSASEVGIAGLYKSLHMKTGAYIHFGLLEVSAVGAYQVHYVSKVSVQVREHSIIPEELQRVVGTAMTALKEFINKELGTGVITFIDGIFGKSEVDTVFTHHILPLHGLEPIVEKKDAPTAEKTDTDKAETAKKESQGAEATSS